MRIRIMIILSVIVLSVLNYGIYQKEQIKKHGETLFLELTPFDPRSLIQGDYMSLSYAIERNIPFKGLASQQKRGYIVVRPDQNNVAQFVRFHKKENLAAEEKLLRFHKLHIVPYSFLFQEGHAHYYKNAKYGVFKLDAAGRSLLVGLADENRKTIIVQ